MAPAALLPPWSGEATLASEYISKGVGRSDGQPHVGLRIQRGLGADTYAGAWVGSLRKPLGADAETQLFVGWRRDVGGWSLDLRPTYKLLLNTGPAPQTTQWEIRADAARAIGGARLRLRVEYGPDGFGSARDSTWMEAQVSRPLAPGWSASASLGRRLQEVGADYAAWSVGVQRDLGRGLALDLRWVDSDNPAGGRDDRDRAVAGLTARF